MKVVLDYDEGTGSLGYTDNQGKYTHINHWIGLDNEKNVVQTDDDLPSIQKDANIQELCNLKQAGYSGHELVAMKEAGLL